jgi:nucleoside-diphosphate-sugar epimerase
MRIALTGASGFIGAAICRALKARGHIVIALVRASSRRDHIEPFVDTFIVGDHTDGAAWDDLLEHAEAVIHNSLDSKAFGDFTLLPPPETFADHLRKNLVSSLMLLRASAPRPFVFMSTIAVHHDMRERWGGQIDEDHPMRPSSDYGAYKAAVESHLWAEHFCSAPPRHTVAIRPCAVYGIDPNLPRSRGYEIVQALREGGPFKKPGGGKFIHVDDVAEATVSALSHPEAAGEPFNLVDCYARWADWARIACEIMGIRREIDFSCPEQPRDQFSKARTRDILGVEMNRGHDGIRRHLEELIKALP